MKNFRTVVLAGLVLGCVSMGQTAPAHAQKLRDRGYCVLDNVKVRKTIYKGDCRITQENKEYGALITVRMGDAEPFKFGCQRNGSCQMGPTTVRLKDRGNGSATFRWPDFKLNVDAR
jgi:hypothetical protein